MINNRIQQIRQSLGLSQKEFGQHIGLKQNAISNLEKKNTPITQANIKLICLRYKVKEEWLTNGTGEMFEDDRLYSEFFEVFEQLNPTLQIYMMKTAEDLLGAQGEMNQ